MTPCPCNRCERGRFARWAEMIKAGQFIEVTAQIKASIDLRVEEGIAEDLTFVLSSLEEGLTKTAISELEEMVATEEKNIELNPGEFDCLKEVTG